MVLPTPASPGPHGHHSPHSHMCRMLSTPPKRSCRGGCKQAGPWDCLPASPLLSHQHRPATCLVSYPTPSQACSSPLLLSTSVQPALPISHLGSSWFLLIWKLLAHCSLTLLLPPPQCDLSADATRSNLHWSETLNFDVIKFIYFFVSYNLYSCDVF